MATPLLIIGAGGFSLEVIWLANAMNATGAADWEIAGLADDRVAVGERMGGYAVLGSPLEAVSKVPAGASFHIAIGDNAVRQRIAEQLTAAGLVPATLVSPRAEVATDASIGAGSFIGHFVSIAPEAVVGAHALINVSAVVGHEAQVQDFAQLCPGVVVTGQCQVGQGAFLGSNAVLHPGVKIGDWARVSANTFAAMDVEPGVTLATMPGRPVFKRK
ncbi:acetyltransferase [Cerasicoccus fimbriatus]|uniref:acetyltransferase n=1 Tax=Cerasicoccus fimbriatus TaxID=3014554 RepID=UPI0022B3C116|nr:acetyltransferase [Cerasicoccus sp. TK19100]